MSDTALLAAADAMAAAAGLGPVRALRPMPQGGNNRLFRLDTAAGPAVLKAYFQDGRDRLGAEFAFAELAWSAGLRSLPQPLAADRDRRLALYALVPGRRPTPAEVDAAAVDAALAFVVAVNGLRGRAAGLPDGAEACFSVEEHLATVERRLARLAAQVEEPAVVAFVRDEVLALWRRLADALRRQAESDGIDPAAALDPADRVVSPSDFGFHNALIDEAGRLCFLDFEYAGWDDPAKLVGDMFHQVQVPVPRRHYGRVRDGVAALARDPAALARRIDLLQPVYGVKWVAILLNEFLPEGMRRRVFAGAAADVGELRRQQFAKARDALTALRSRLADGARAGHVPQGT